MSHAFQMEKAHLEKGGVPIFHDLNFEVPADSYFSIIGPNGAGKSFLIKTFLGLEKITHGTLKVLEAPVHQMNHLEIGYVPQYKTFSRNFPALVEEFIASGIHSGWPISLPAAVREKVKTCLNQIRSSHLMGKSMNELSGGELQRVYLARCFIRERKMIILDEPATGVDMMGEADLYEILENYRAKNFCCIVMVTHDVEVARHHSSHVLLMNKNQISFGPPKEALLEENLNRAFGHSQHHHHGEHG